MVIGKPAGRSAMASVTTTCRRYGVTARSTPAVAASSRDHAPAQQTTTSASISPSAVRTPLSVPPSTSTDRTSTPVRIVAPCLRAPAA